MSSFGAGLAGFANGMNSGLLTGQRLAEMYEQKQIADVRAQGLAEAKAMQAAAAPKIQDLGDEQNLTSNPQMSRDPNAQPEPVNTSLQQFQNNAQAQQDGGPGSMPVAPPQAQDTNTLSDKPLASAAPGTAPRDPDAAPAFANGLPQTPRKRFNVDGQEFDTQEEAAAHVKKSTPALHTFFKDTLIPKMTDALIAQGKPEQAAAWQKYADEDQTRTNMATWGKAIRLAQFGDHSGAAEELFKLHPHFDDGYEVVKSEPTKGPNGADGFTMIVKGPDGKEEKMYQDAQTITEIGLSQLSPIEMFNKRFARQTQADVLKAKEAIDVRNDGRTADRQLANAKERDAAAEKRQAAKIDADKARDEQRGKDKMEQIEKAYKLRAQNDADRIKAAGVFRKGTSPEETRKQVYLTLARDPMFSLASPDEQNDRIERAISQINAGPAKAAPAQVVPNPGLDPRQQGVQTSSAPAGKRAVQVWDAASGGVKTIYR
jgi:hypothetical protein